MRRFPPLPAVLLAGCTSVVPGTPNDGPDAQERWWTWAASSPDGRNPVVDDTGEFCAADQPADVWFVAGTFGGAVERACEVPADRPLVGPAVNYLAASAEECARLMRNAYGEVVLDGEPQDVRPLGPSAITVTGKPGNSVSGVEGAYRAYACGLWVRIPPLPPGEHRLVVEGRNGAFRTTADYALTVRASAA